MQRTPVVTFWQHGWIIFKTALRATHTTLKKQKTQQLFRIRWANLQWQELGRQRHCVHRMLSSVNSVTSIALHGPPQWCVSAAEAGYHNRNSIQAFYSRQETCCIPSNNTHCLSIHILLCNPSPPKKVHVCADATLLRMRVIMGGATPVLHFLLFISVRHTPEAAP